MLFKLGTVMAGAVVIAVHPENKPAMLVATGRSTKPTVVSAVHPLNIYLVLMLEAKVKFPTEVRSVQPSNIEVELSKLGRVIAGRVVIPVFANIFLLLITLSKNA